MTPHQQNTSKGRWMFVPDGWQVVVKNLDKSALQAGYLAFLKANKNQVYGEAIFDCAYQEALAASPSPPEVRGVTGMTIAQVIKPIIESVCSDGNSDTDRVASECARAVLRLLAPSDQDVTG